MNKTLKVMTSAALLAGVVAPVAVTTVSANSTNVVSKVVSLDDDYTSYDSTNDTYTEATSIYIGEDDVPFKSGDSFRISLPSGVKFLEGAYDEGNYLVGGNAPAAKDFKIVQVTEQDIDLEIAGADWSDAGTPDSDKVEIPLFFEIDGADNGEVQLTVDGKQSTISSGKYPVAIVSDGATNATISKVETIGDGDAIETIRIDETSIGALYLDDKSEQEVTLKLPSKFEWKNVDETAPYSNIKLGGGFNAGNVNITSVDLNDNKDKITIKFKVTAKPASTGTIYVEDLNINADNDASYGKVEVDIDGDEVTSQTLEVADYQEYGTTAKLKGDIPTLVAGRGNYDTDDLKTVEFEVKEATEGSWLAGRAVKIAVPSLAKIVGVDVTAVENLDKTGGGNYSASDLAKIINDEIDGDESDVEFDLPTDLKEDGKKSFKVKLFVSSKANETGDVTVKIDGRAGVELEDTVIAKVIAPVTAEVTKAEVRTGIQAQPINDIVITENIAGALTEDGGKRVKIYLPDDVEFSSKPKVEVVEGNLDIDETSISLTSGDSAIEFDIDSVSTRASKIKISGLKLDLDRSVAEGDVPVKIGGTALVKNDDLDDKVAFDIAKPTIGDKTYAKYDLSSNQDVGEFDQPWVVKATIATVTTPAEGNATVEEAKFTIGSTSYKVGAKELTMDVAPFVEAGRTYMPIKFAAQAVGVDGSNINWDQATQTAVIIKGDRVAELKLGTNVVKVNGASITMPDAKVQLKNNRVVLPIKYVAQALGANVNWNEADQTVTVK